MRREQRTARNQAVFREANERIERSRRRLALDGQATPFICECSDERCTTIVLLGADDYAEVRAHPNRFLVATGHEGDERLVAAHDGYSVVEKEGEQAAWTSAESG